MQRSEDRPNRAIDLAQLDRYTGGDSVLNGEILRLFRDQIAELVERLQTVLKAGDDRTWHGIAHSLKGAARGVGAFGFADAAAEAEAFRPGSQHAQAIAALAALNGHAGAVLRFIDDYLRSLSNTANS